MNQKPPPAPSAGGNSAALDQWRGLALVFVLVSHGFYFTGHVQGIGRVGVNLFFFISGVLVFRSLTGHHDRTAWERTRHFWWRRARRLYPALATYVLAMIPVVYLLRHVPGAVTFGPANYFHGVPAALVYGINYWPARVEMSLGHLWSLACEMQFYLLGPLIFLAGGKSAAQRNLVWGGLLSLFVVSGFGGAMLDKAGDYKYHFEIAVWPMMLGFFCEYRQDLFRRIPAKWFHGIIVLSVVAFAAMTVMMFSGYEMKKPVIAVGSLSFVPCFLAYIGNRVLRGPIGRLLTWLGERTYSIYLWQQPLTICNYLPTVLHPVGAILAAFAGGLWFRWFEQPFLSAKRQHVTAAQTVPRRRNHRRLVMLLLAVIFVGALAAGVAVRHRYAESLAARVWPTERFVASGFMATNAPGGVLLLGDSRIADWGRPDIDGRPVSNAGFRGATSAELAMVTPEIVQQVKPGVVVIQAGINDLKLLGVYPAWREKVVDTCASNILVMVRDAERSGARVIIMPIWPAGNIDWRRRFVWSDAVNPAVLDANSRVKKAVAGDPNVVVEDFLTEIAPAEADRLSLYADSLHLKPAAYAQMAKPLAARLAALDAGRGPAY